MRFNERELIAMANCTTFTVRGILWKRLKLGSTYKDRYCCLKNNLFFYYTVSTNVGIDGTVVRQTRGELLGVVVIENMVVQELPIDERHFDQKFGFSIYYRSQETDSPIPSKMYEFRCATREIQRYWMGWLKSCSFSSLRRQYTYLRDEFSSLNVDLPPNQVIFEDKTPQVTFSNVQTFLPRGKHSTKGTCISPPAPVRKLIDIDIPLKRISSYAVKRPEYKGLELKLSCSNLIPYPDVGYFIEVFAGGDKKFSPVTFARTETIYNCSQAYFCSTILLDKDKLLAHRTLLTFQIKQIRKELTDVGTDITINTQHTATIPVPNITIKTENVIMTEDGQACITVNTSKPITQLYLKPQKFYEKFHKHFHETKFCTQRTPCDLLFLNPLYIYSIKKTYDFSNNDSAISPQSIQPSKLRAMEVTAESPYNNIIPIEFLKLCLKDNRNICVDLISLGPLLSTLEIHKQKLVYSLDQQTTKYSTIINELVELQYFFHASSQRECPKLSFLPINLHIQKLISTNETPNTSPLISSPSPVSSAITRITAEQVPSRGVPVSRTNSDIQVTTSFPQNTLNTLSYVTMGAPTHHVAGFKRGSILTMLQRCKQLPFYVFTENNPSRRYIELADELEHLFYTFTEYKDFLMRTVANSAFATSQEALAGISKTVQQIFTMLESKEIQSGIREFNQLTGIVSSGWKTSTLNRSEFGSPDGKSKLKIIHTGSRHSWFPGQDGDDKPAVPDFTTHSPINDTKLPAQAKLSYTSRQASILQAYIDLTETVDVVTSNIIGVRGHLVDISQQPLAISSQVDMLSWSDELIPMLSNLLLRINSLLTMAKKGLTLKRMQCEKSIENYVEILERHDVIMSQLLTGLVTSFAQTFQTQAQSYSHLLAMTSFLEKCTRIGYLFNVESYISVIDVEKFMLEDLAFGIQQLSSVKIKLTCGCCHDHPEITGSRMNMIIILPICTAYYKILPVRLRESDILVYPLLFSRSVSTEVNQTNLPDSDYALIASTNKQSIIALKNYYEFCYRHKEILLHPLTKRVTILDKLTAKLANPSFSSRFCNVYDMELFHLVERATRELEGGMVLISKNGKDRTGCAATLQQAQFLQDTYPDFINEECKQRIATVMRMSGTKLDVCAKNINIPQFSIDPANLNFFPPSLAPPIEVCFKHQLVEF